MKVYAAVMSGTLLSSDEILAFPPVPPPIRHRRPSKWKHASTPFKNCRTRLATKRISVEGIGVEDVRFEELDVVSVRYGPLDTGDTRGATA